MPTAVRQRTGWRRVDSVAEVWRVDDGWWRSSRVRRTYFRLALQGGDVVTLYRDDDQGTWWWQRY